MEKGTEGKTVIEAGSVSSILDFKCKFCHRKLSSRQNLREHLYIHTDEKPYFCTEPGCGQKFRQGSLLSMHKKIHQEVNKNKPIILGTYQKSLYPKLTDLLQQHLNFPEELPEDIITQLKPSIGEKFYFIKHFFN